MLNYFFRISFIYFLFFFFTLHLTELFAQQVIPSERVTNKVNERKNPDARSAVVDFLWKGE